VIGRITFQQQVRPGVVGALGTQRQQVPQVGGAQETKKAFGVGW
jgi:hypothetical protein